MKLTTKQRSALRMKFGGRCAYCGCLLPEKGWHADHVEPVLRISEIDEVARKKGLWKLRNTGDVTYASRENIENHYPACAPCNLFKATFSVEVFREQIAKQVERARASSVNFRTAERFGQIEVTQAPVIFWFERYREEENAA
ncbi:HNH endonuclease [Pantoea sp. DY-15]|uniref:HNH endonuclease n=1 Tax=Pantoea sp. DY-15 TaxID=2871489 RepID=UPI001C969C8A|nr:HNH endonuclease signature motif containing protein [Pantoea sp. DY-15]MBY4887729.1 HNH endonuclease [Pantoea sp. DY-15]